MSRGWFRLPEDSLIFQSAPDHKGVFSGGITHSLSQKTGRKAKYRWMLRDYDSARNDVFKIFGKQQVYIATGFFCLWDPSTWLLLWHIVFSLVLFLVSSLSIHTETHTHTLTSIHSFIVRTELVGSVHLLQPMKPIPVGYQPESDPSLAYASPLYLVNVGCFHHITSNNNVTHPFVNIHFQDIGGHFLALHMVIYRRSSLLTACLFHCRKAHSKRIFKTKQSHS